MRWDACAEPEVSTEPQPVHHSAFWQKKIQRFVLPYHQTTEQLFLFGSELLNSSSTLHFWGGYFCDWCDFVIIYPLTYSLCHCFATLCCIIMVRITVNYVKMLLSVGPGSLKSIIEALSYKPEVWSLKEVSREGLIKDAFELHCGTWKYTQRLLRSKNSKYLPLLLPFDDLFLFASHNFMEIQ